MMRDPELESLRDSLIASRNYEYLNGTPEGAQAIDDAIVALNQHPLLKAARSAALDEMARIGQELET